MSDHRIFSSCEGQEGAANGKQSWGVSGSHRALDGWMLARVPASPTQVAATMDLGILIFLISVRCMAL